ncbi:MAG: FHA domain-containing protein [Phycisphaerae bacterium]
MSVGTAELVVVAGPQEGERFLLGRSVMVIGRSADTDIQLREETASRRHMQFTLTHDGWVVENLSSNGTRINGKRYKKDRPVVLETGDTCGAGEQTELLFVAPGDDPDMAVRAWRESQGLPPVVGVGGEEPAEPAPPPPLEESFTPKPTADPQEVRAQSRRKATTAADQIALAEAEREESGRKKLIIYGGILGASVVLFLGIGLFAAFQPDTAEKSSVFRGQPPRVEEDIPEMIRQPIKRQVSSSLADDWLVKAQNMYENRNFRPNNLFRTVRNYKMHLAYLDAPELRDPEDHTEFRTAQSEYIDMVMKKYRAAWIHEQAQRWGEAEEGFQELLQECVPPDSNWDTPGYQALRKNIFRHSNFVRRRYIQENKRYR